MTSTRATTPDAMRRILTPDRRLRVFVSSTLEELAEEREAVRMAIESLRLVPVMFEMGARPHPPRNLYRAYLAQSDVFLAIYWQRYGWVAPGEDVSGLEDEYQLSHGMPRLVYVKHPAEAREPRMADLLRQLRDHDDSSYKRFRTPDELARLVADDLAVMLSEAFHSEEPAVAEPAPVIVSSTLPAEPTPFVGRASEISEVTDLLDSADVRLVSLTGPGGIGKTRLALRVAAQAQAHYPDGVFVALLAESRDARQLPDLIGAALGLRDVGPSSPLDVVKERLVDRHALLVLDNFEHVLAGADIVAELLAAAPRLKVVVTSREALRLQAEHEYRVPPLTAGEEEMSPEVQMRMDAVRLFEQRVRAVRRDFVVDSDNVDGVVEICRRLDGLPLAIELAAARTRVLPVEALLERLQCSLEFLVGGARDLPDRQRTLRSTIDWSYGLLDESEQQVFARLSVFAGSFSLEAVDAVLSPDGIEPLSMVTSLADKSLLQPQLVRCGETRFRMLTMIRDYAMEQLVDSGELEAMGRRHADYYRELALAADVGLRGPRQAAWMRRLGRLSGGVGDVANIRAAFDWFVDHGELEDVAVMAWGLWLPSWMAGDLDEPRRAIRRALAVDAPVSRRGRARMLTVLGMFSVWKGDEADAVPALDEALHLARAEGDDVVVGHATLVMSLVQAADGDATAALASITESLELFKQRGDVWGEATARVILGWMHVATETHPETATEFEETLALARRAGDDLMVAMAEDNLAEHYLHTGDLERPSRLLESALGRFRSLRSTYTAAYCIDGIARRAHLLGRFRSAARLLGATEVMREQIGAPIWSSAGARHDSLVRKVHAGLDAGDFADAWSEGRRMHFDEALDEGLAELAATT